MRRECDCHAMKLLFLVLLELTFIHREIILLTKGCKKTNFVIQAEYFSPPLLPLKSFHWHIQINDAMQFQESSALSPDLLLTVYLFF